jgi:hypothetical protein
MVQKISPALKFFFGPKTVWKRGNFGEDFPQKWMKFFRLPKTSHRLVVRRDNYNRALAKVAFGIPGGGPYGVPEERRVRTRQSEYMEL